jgi:DNA-binding transcriptional MocR family regulator
MKKVSSGIVPIIVIDRKASQALHRQIYNAYRTAILDRRLRPGQRIWSNLVARHCRKMRARSFHYGDPMGSMAFRETIASYLRTARSLRCEARQIMIVSGSQRALEITARVLLDPGEAGMHLAVTRQARSRDLEIAERAAGEKLWIWPLSPAYLGAVPRPGFILGFGGTPVEQIPPAVRKLRNMLFAGK